MQGGSSVRRWTAGAAIALFALPAAALDLVTAYLQALENDANFLAARASTDAQREALPQARAWLLPNLSFSGNRSKNNTDITQNSGSGPLTRHFDYFAEGQNLTLRQPLYRRAILAQYRQAEAQVAGAELLLERERQNLAAKVAAAYFDLLAAQEQLRAFAEQKTAYQEQWLRFQAMFEKGAGTRTDRDEAKARYDMAIAQEIDAVNALDLAERTLAAMTNSPAPAVSLALLDGRRVALEPPVPVSFEEWVKLAENSNPELASMRYAIEAAQQEVTKQGSGHLPTLDLIVQHSYSASETVSIIGSQYNTRMLGFQLAIPIFSGGAVVSAERQALANVERARQQYEAARRQMTLNVRREFNNVVQGIVKVRALEQALQSAEQALRSTEMGVKAGTRNNLEVLNARQQLYTTQRDLGRARYDYVVGRLKLKAAAGTLAVEDIEATNRWLTVAR
jgi:outer membrane protein/protease secretion system outer membrane protein